MITVMATIEVNPGKGEDFIKEYRKALPKVLKDPVLFLREIRRPKSGRVSFFNPAFQGIIRQNRSLHERTTHNQHMSGSVESLLLGE
jgi:hypothetical protein